MNYAEDRLDRRARCTESEVGTATKTASTRDQLAFDLERSHDAIRACRRSLARPLAVEREKSILQSLRELSAAHELAGRTLRDGGRNREAVFHFGMAWKICHRLEKSNDRCHPDGSVIHETYHEWKSVGDYAQMCELSGFPEIGALALLFYRAGGSVDLDSMASSVDSNDEEPKRGNEEGKFGCGCGIAECGESPCFVAFPRSSPVVGSILRAFDELSIGPREAFPTAAEILAELADITQKSDPKDPVPTMHAFLSKRGLMEGVPPILHYWDDKIISSPEQESTQRDQRLGAATRRHRILPPLILILLLKLLYSSPMASPFLQLACISLPYLAGRFPPVSPEGRMMAKEYKSHWAYYVFIRVLVLGERMKKHRKRKVVHHTPVWDVVFGLDTNQSVIPKKEDEVGAPIPDREKISSYWLKTLTACTPQCAQAISPYDTTKIHTFQHQDSSLPCIIQQRMSSYSFHPPIFILGDSHALSLAWHTLHIDSSQVPSNNAPESIKSPIYRTAFPFPATGMKAWHVRPSTQFFTHYNLCACLKRLPPSARRSIIVSAGEIDCREGIGGTLLQGYYRDCSDAVEQTVREYLTALNSLADEFQTQILVMPVAPHAYRSEKNGKSVGRARRRETMCLWNEILRRELAAGRRQKSAQSSRVFLLDYEKKLLSAEMKSPTGYVLHPSYNADYTHVNSAIVPLVEDAILRCECDLSLL